mmetsp:Transcript_55614/g.121821  ORF Transcript_55614/g.121821 Transcript_55614/m.121821 type:complete len:206 (+) Transcript_55614:211-828(+)
MPGEETLAPQALHLQDAWVRRWRRRRRRRSRRATLGTTGAQTIGSLKLAPPPKASTQPTLHTQLPDNPAADAGLPGRGRLRSGGWCVGRPTGVELHLGCTGGWLSGAARFSDGLWLAGGFFAGSFSAGRVASRPLPRRFAAAWWAENRALAVTWVLLPGLAGSSSCTATRRLVCDLEPLALGQLGAARRRVGPQLRQAVPQLLAL